MFTLFFIFGSNHSEKTPFHGACCFFCISAYELLFHGRQCWYLSGTTQLYAHVKSCPADMQCFGKFNPMLTFKGIFIILKSRWLDNGLCFHMDFSLHQIQFDFDLIFYDAKLMLVTKLMLFFIFKMSLLNRWLIQDLGNCLSTVKSTWEINGSMVYSMNSSRNNSRTMWHGYSVFCMLWSIKATVHWLLLKVENNDMVILVSIVTILVYF